MNSDQLETAVNSAKTFFTSTMANVVDLQLEEVEITDDERFRLLTFSGLVPAREESSGTSLGAGGITVSNMATIFGPKRDRIYRVFKVDESGWIKSMKIRNFNE